MTDQVPWIGSLYGAGGIYGQKIAIVGQWRHVKTNAVSSEEFTINFMNEWLKTKPMNSFFSYIQNYFPSDVQADFWNRVVFFNLLPNCLNSKTDTFSKNDQSTLLRARARFCKIVESSRPDKIIVFSNSPGKGWMALREEVRNRRAVGNGLPKEFEVGEYLSPNHSATIYGLRYPQGAPREIMRRAVGVVLKGGVL